MHKKIKYNSLKNNIFDQSFSSVICFDNIERSKNLSKELADISSEFIKKSRDIDIREISAKLTLDDTKKSIGHIYESGRGGVKGAHGFVYERAEVGITNARNQAKGEAKTAVLYDNNGKADISLNGVDVQLKAYSDLNSELSQVSKYPNMRFMVPKDHNDIYHQIYDGEENIVLGGEKLSKVQIEHLRKKLNDICEARGETLDEWLADSNVNSTDLDQKNIEKRINEEEKQIKDDLEKERQEEQDKTEEKQNVAQDKYKANFKDATKFAGINAAIVGGYSLVEALYKKYKEGKSLTKLSQEEWLDILKSTGCGVVKGAASGYVIYGLVNLAKVPAPVAGAANTIIFDTAKNTKDYMKGEISGREAYDNIMYNAINTSILSLGATLGNVLIPIPVVGALIGSVVTNVVKSSIEDFVDKKEYESIVAYQNEIDQYVKNLDIELQKEYQEIIGYYNQLNELRITIDDFDVDPTIRFEYNKEYNKLAGVKDYNKFETIEEGIAFFLS